MIIAVCLLLLTRSGMAMAQDKQKDALQNDSLAGIANDSISMIVDTTALHREVADKWSTCRPDPKRAL